jgi:hypothetical protein
MIVAPDQDNSPLRSFLILCIDFWSYYAITSLSFPIQLSIVYFMKKDISFYIKSLSSVGLFSFIGVEPLGPQCNPKYLKLNRRYEEFWMYLVFTITLIQYMDSWLQKENSRKTIFRFIKRVDQKYDNNNIKQIFLILDNVSIHKSNKVKETLSGIIQE